MPAAPSTPAPSSVAPHVDATQKRPVIEGTDIKVSQVAYEYERKGMTPDEIIDAHPHLSLADVHSALAYYYDHRDAIHTDWRKTEELIRELEGVYPRRGRG